MPDRGDANLFEILVGQVTQNFEINIILDKALSVLPETEPFEPVHNLLHRRPSTDLTLSVLDRHVAGVYQPSARSKYPGAASARPTPNKVNRHVRARPSRLWSVLPPDVRFGSKADICSAKPHVRFTPESDIGYAIFR